MLVVQILIVRFVISVIQVMDLNGILLVKNVLVHQVMNIFPISVGKLTIMSGDLKDLMELL